MMINGEGEPNTNQLRLLAGVRSDSDASALHWAANEIVELRKYLKMTSGSLFWKKHPKREEMLKLIEKD